MPPPGTHAGRSSSKGHDEANRRRGRKLEGKTGCRVCRVRPKPCCRHGPHARNTWVLPGSTWLGIIHRPVAGDLPMRPAVGLINRPNPPREGLVEAPAAAPEEPSRWHVMMRWKPGI